MRFLNSSSDSADSPGFGAARRTSSAVPLTAVALLCFLATVALSNAAFAQASNFDDWEIADSVTSTAVYINGDNQTDTTGEATERETIVAPVGVEDCTELLNNPDGDRNIRFEWSGVSGQNIDDQRLREYNVAIDPEPRCRLGSNPDTEACDRISEMDGNAIRLNLNESPPNISFRFRALMSYQDDAEEVCAFQGSDETAQSGDAGMADAGVADTGSRMDTGSGTGADLPDILYNARLFLQSSQSGDDPIPTDAAVYLDRTRPPSPGELSNVAASQNSLQFTIQRPNERVADVENFWLFYSFNEFNAERGENLFRRLPESQRRSLGDKNTTQENAGESFTDSFSPSNLEPGDEIHVAVVTRDKADNFSLTKQTEDPISVKEERGFGDVYSDAGGAESGGCGCASSRKGIPAGLLGILTVFFGFGLIRRRGKAVGIVVGVLLVMSATPAQAESDVSGNFELRLGPYYPAIDSELDGAQPFQNTFGSNGRVLGEIKVDRYLFTGHGKLGVGGSVAYTNFSGEGEIVGGSDGGSGNDGSGGGGSGDGDSGLNAETNLQMLPIRAQVFYRWDYLVEEFNIPLAARVEAGLDWYMWRIRDGSGNTATFGDDGPKASGATAGYHGAAGLEFNLNALDRQSAASFDYSWGINRTYFFAMYEISRVDDFGGNGFNLSDNSWRLGLAFEF